MVGKYRPPKGEPGSTGGQPRGKVQGGAQGEGDASQNKARQHSHDKLGGSNAENGKTRYYCSCGKDMGLG